VKNAAGIEAHVRRAVRRNLYQDTDTTASQLTDDADDTLFENILASPQRVLHHLLPSQSSTCSSPPPAKPNSPLVNCDLAVMTVKSDSRNFTTRQLFKDIY